MAEFPDDILRQAFDLVESMKSNKADALTTSDTRYASLLTDDANAVARAVMAERERIASRLDNQAWLIEESARARREHGSKYANEDLPIARKLRDEATAIRGQS